MRSLSELMDAAEEADGQYARAVTMAAEARADYELDYHKALVGVPSDLKSAAARKEYAESMSRGTHAEWLAFEAAEKAAKTHVQVLLGLLVASQSLQKHAGKLDGGDF